MSVEQLVRDLGADYARENTEWRRWACGKLCDCEALVQAGPQWSARPIESDRHRDGCRYKVLLEEIAGVTG